MLFIIIFLAGGAAFVAVKEVPIGGSGNEIALPWIAAAVIFFPLILGLSWADNQVGVSEPIVHSWQFLSGLPRGGEIIAGSKSCPGAGVNVMLSIVIWLAIFNLLFASFVMGLVGIIGMPVGIAWTMGGAVLALVKREKESLAQGLKILVVATGCIILTCVSLRIVHALSSVVWGC
jgi:hypothetical protein